MSRGIEHGDSPYHPENEHRIPMDGLSRLDPEGNFASPLDARSKFSIDLSGIESSTGTDEICAKSTIGDLLHMVQEVPTVPNGIAKRYHLERRPLEDDALSYREFLAPDAAGRCFLEKEDARTELGSVLLARAEELEIAEAVFPKEVFRQAHVRTHKTFPIEAEEGITSMRDMSVFYGFFVFADKQGELFLMIPEGDRDSMWKKVSLDRLVHIDPTFVEKQLSDYQERANREKVASSVRDNQKLHELSEEELFPPFMQELAEIADPGERRVQSSGLITFLMHIKKLGVIDPQDIDDVESSLMQSTNYLGHMATCHTEAAEDQQKYADLKNVVDSLREDRDIPDAPSFGQDILRDPLDFIYGQGLPVEESRQEKEKEICIADFYASAKGVIDKQSLQELIEEKLPDSAETLARFRELENGNQFISEFGRDMLFGRERLFERISSFSALQEALSRKLGSDTRIWWEDARDLQILLPVLVLAEVQNTVKALDLELSQDSKRNYTSLYTHMQQETDRKITEIDRNLVDATTKKQQFEAFKAFNFISDEELANLKKIAEYNDYSGEPAIQSELYTALFTALVLSKQGEVDIHGSTIKSLVSWLWPDHAEKIEAHL